MRRYDLSPLYSSTIGFDRLFSRLAERSEAESGYPPYNIEKTGDDAYRITIAAAGFDESELSVESRENTLTVTGAKRSGEEGSQPNYLFRGIAGRTFERRFQLADYVTVGGATLHNGLLHIDLMRELPESAKPKQIKIGTGSAQRLDVSNDDAKQAIAA